MGLEGGSKRTHVTGAWDMVAYNAAAPEGKKINGTDHIVILTDGTELTSLSADWYDQDGAVLTTVTLPPGRYEMNASEFTTSAAVILITM